VNTIAAALTVLLIAPLCGLGADALVFVGTATNTTNPKQPTTAPVRLTFDQDANGVLTISPPLVGSGRCQIGQYNPDSGRIEISCTGAVNLIWSGTIKGSKATGTYIVEGTPQSGHFEWSLVLPTDGNPSAKSNGQAVPAIASALSGAGDGLPVVPRGCSAPQLLEKHDGIFPKANLDAALNNAAKDTRISEILAGGYAEADIIIDDSGRSGERGGGDGATFIQITDPTPRSHVLEQILDNNLGSWKWVPASCSGSQIYALNPGGIIGLNANSQYTVHALAHVRYRFERLTKGDISITTTYTVGNSPACKSLVLIYAPEPRRAILGSTAPFLVCGDRGK
jgi:hypothetical protein